MKLHIQQLDKITIKSLSNPLCALVIIDTSVKNDITMSILYTHIHNRLLIKMLHHVVYITSSEAKLFAIRYRINQATNLSDISKIIVITDSIHVAKRIFDPSIHPFQVHTATILKELQFFFSCHQDNSIEFQEYPSQSNWILYRAVNKETKSFNSILLFPYKMLQNLSKKRECNDIMNRWKMTF